MQKVLSINRFTGIDQRSSIGTPDHPLVNQPLPPSISDIHKVFMTDGVPLAITACQKALAESHVPPSSVTHMVSTTCTDSSNPGYDHYVAKGLGLSPQVQKVLLHGVGCAGGLTALRTAANLCLGHTMRRLPARILVLALEVSTVMVRSELESIASSQETRIGVCLFSDCASAVLLSNNIPDDTSSSPLPPPIYSLLGYHNSIIPDTEQDLGFDVDPVGWKVILTPRVPSLTRDILQPSYESLISSLPPLPADYTCPADFDWAMHPGGATILTGAEKALSITPEHMRASYDTYINHGNSSSATIFSVLNRLRQKDMDALAPGGSENVKELVVGCAFGPGIAVEMCMLRRNLGDKTQRRGIETPPESEGGSEQGSEIGDDVEGKKERLEKDVIGGAGEKDEKEEEDEEEKEKEEAFITQALESVELD